jgi:hypothetical protein
MINAYELNKFKFRGWPTKIKLTFLDTAENDGGHCSR